MLKLIQIQPVALTRSTDDGSPLAVVIPPCVQPQYYAAIIVAEAIGQSGNVQVDEINIDHDEITGYAFYEGGEIARAVFINLKAYTSDSADRIRVHLDLGFTNGTRTPVLMFVKRLVIEYAFPFIDGKF